MKRLVIAAAMVVAMMAQAESRPMPSRAPIPIGGIASFDLSDEGMVTSAAWASCSGPPGSDGHVTLTTSQYFTTIACLGVEHEKAALDSLDAVEKALRDNYAYRADLARFWLTRMQIRAAHKEIRTAKQDGEIANALEMQWNGERFSEEQATYWDMLPSPMRDVLRAHGGIRTDNMSARPQEWKFDGADDVWVYRSGGASVMTYVFTRGKLARTLKA